MPPRRPPFDLDRAEEIGIHGLTFLAADAERLVRFLGVTGYGPADLHAARTDPSVLAAVLEYLLGEEALLLELAANRNIPPEDIQRAWDQLTLEALRRSRV